MSFSKQLAASLIVLVVAGGLWLRFYPGAGEMLERWGLDGLATSVAPAVDEPSGPAGGGMANGQPVLVVASSIETATINDRLAAIGTGRALDSVSVTPFASGRLTEIMVEAGSRVEAGDTLAMLDSEAEEIARDRARIALSDAEARLQRIQALRASNTATAVQVTEAELAVENARLALRDAELTLARRAIVAPIGGVVGILPVSVGNAVTTQTQIATIDDRSRIVVDFWAPERFAGAIFVGQPVTAASVARPGETHRGEVSAVDSRIDPQSRTLHVQARLANDDDRLRAGMAFQVEMAFAGDTYPAVDPLAIQWGTEGAFVWSLDATGTARRVAVRIIQRNTDSVLVVGDFNGNQRVVTEGIHAVREGEIVRVAGEADDEAIGPQASILHNVAQGTR